MARLSSTVASLLLVFAGALAGAPLTAQQEPAGELPRAHRPVVYAPLQARLGGLWYAVWNPATGTPRAIWGTGHALDDWRGSSLEEARRHAVRLLDEHAPVLGLGTSEFREVIGARMGRSWSFVFDQHFQGLPAIGGRADVRINERGVLAMLGSTAWPIPADFDTTPQLAADAAAAFAWMALGEEPRGGIRPAAAPNPRLVIWGDVHRDRKAPFYLAWEVPIDSFDPQTGQGSIGRSYVDARTGRVLHFASDRHECGFPGCDDAGAHAATDEPLARRDLLRSLRPLVAGAAAPAPLLPVPTTVTVQAWTRAGLSGADPLTNIPLQNLQVSVPGVGTRVTDQNGQFSIDIAQPVTITIGRLDGVHCRPIGGSSEPNVSVQVQPGVATTIQLLTQSSGSSQAAHPTCYYWTDRTNVWARSILGNTSQLATASDVLPSVNQSGTCNAFYTNNTINFFPAGGGCNNTAISTVIAHEWGHGLDARYGGISNNTGDGLSEGWGDILGMYLVDDPIVGRGFTGTTGFIRDGNNGRLYPPTGQTVHRSGEVWMGFAWRLRQALATVYTRQQAIDISNAIVVGSIVADATNQPDAVREVFLADDDDGNLLNGTPNYSSLEAAAQQKNLPYPQRQLLTIAHAPLQTTDRELVPRLAEATVAPVSGAVTGARLVYTVPGNAPQVRDMFPSGAPDGYRAMLPGVALNTTVSYHFEGLHDSGAVVRWPQTGEFSYRVAADDILFAEDFESGAPGWTHGLVQQQDDWQLGSPAGRSGTGWTDPSQAASGSACYANDLGNQIGTQLWNGAYQNNVINWLRAPSIDTTGRFGVRLRFQRWLTVESGQYDRAEIWVNGTRVWVNNFSADHIDTAWTAFELPIPSADNNPNVTIEWRLTTDGGLTFGGWNIDDVEVLVPGVPQPNAALLTMLPEQAAIGQQTTLQLQTQGSQPALIVFGTDAGPTVLPGVPDLEVGGLLSTLFTVTDPAGLLTLPLPMPVALSAEGLLIYTQVLTTDPFGAFVASNPHVNYFTP